jgi:hypothetical protein
MESLTVHSSSINQLTTKVQGMNELVESYFDSLKSGFEKLHRALDSTEERVLSWNQDNHLWILSGLVGFTVGSTTGWTKWAMLSGLPSHLTEADGEYFSDYGQLLKFHKLFIPWAL